MVSDPYDIWRTDIMVQIGWYKSLNSITKMKCISRKFRHDIVNRQIQMIKMISPIMCGPILFLNSLTT